MKRHKFSTMRYKLRVGLVIYEGLARTNTIDALMPSTSSQLFSNDGNGL